MKLFTIIHAHCSVMSGAWFEGMSVEDPSTLHELGSGSSPSTPAPTEWPLGEFHVDSPASPTPGWFDGVTLESYYTTSPSSLGEVEGIGSASKEPSSTQDQITSPKDYLGVLTVILILIGLILIVGTLQLWTLRRMIMAMNHREGTTDLEEGCKADAETVLANVNEEAALGL